MEKKSVYDFFIGLLALMLALMFVIDIFPQEETMKEKKTKRRVWRGLATTGTSLLALSLSAAMSVPSCLLLRLLLFL